MRSITLCARSAISACSARNSAYSPPRKGWLISVLTSPSTRLMLVTIETACPGIATRGFSIEPVIGASPTSVMIRRLMALWTVALKASRTFIAFTSLTVRFSTGRAAHPEGSAFVNVGRLGESG